MGGMTMQILVAGNDKNLNRSEIIEVLKFYVGELVDPSVSKMSKVYVDLFQRSQDPGNAGGIVLPSFEYPIGLLHIKLRATQSRKNQLITLAHEMVHAVQIMTGRFGTVRDRYGRLYIMWEKNTYNKDSLLEEGSPWEQEANEQEMILYESYMISRV